MIHVFPTSQESGHMEVSIQSGAGLVLCSQVVQRLPEVRQGGNMYIYDRSLHSVRAVQHPPHDSNLSIGDMYKALCTSSSGCHQQLGKAQLPFMHANLLPVTGIPN